MSDITLTMITVAIIGSAGRKDDASKWSAELYSRALLVAHKTIIEWKLDPAAVELVSGGAAYSDSLAVKLFLSELGYGKITLYLPASYDIAKGEFHDSGSNDWRVNPGRISNNYHRAASRKLGFDSLGEIGAVKRAHYEACTLDIGTGFHQRNSKIACSEYMIAFTFKDGDTPADGGTQDTWKKWNNRSVKQKAVQRKHISLLSI